MLTQERANELFEYREDGNLYWKVDRVRKKIGDKVSSKSAVGYLEVRFDNQLWLCHRIVFLMHYGSIPNVIDHIDGNRSNNKISNLRAATSSQNGANSKARKNNTSGFKGVSYIKPTGKWHAYINKDRKRTNIGHFVTFEEAKEAVQKVRLELYGEFARDA